MNQNNKFLNTLFNNLSSVYSSNDGMINSNLFTLFNAYASVFQNIDDIREDTKNNTYLDYANTDVLEANFSAYVDFPKPPRLNTVTDGGEVYRAILRSIYDAFLNGSTEESMDVGLTTVLSFLTIDESTDSVVTESNNVFFDTFDRSIMLAYPATTSSGTVAQPSDITISPSGLTVTNYNNSTQTITFTGSIPTSGQSYTITYFRSHTDQIDTNWINFTDPSGTSPLPTDLKTIENTFRNPKFSYWWNTFNRDGNGVQIIDGSLEQSEQALVWRLPEKYIRFVSPFNGENKQETINLYNLSGTVYDINSPNKSVNPDVPQTCGIISYVDEVSRTPADYYIRYSQNNSVFTPLDPFIGTVSQVERVSDRSVDFASENFGQLDFFEMGENFNLDDLFGFGTKNVWLNVENQDGLYSLSSNTFFDRPFSLHEDVLFYEFFENGERSLGRMSTISGASALTEVVGVPLQETEDCLMLFSGQSHVSPIIPSGTLVSGNYVSIDIYDAFNSGTTAFVDLNIINPLNNTISGTANFRFVVPDITASGEVTIVPASGPSFYNTPLFNFVDTYFDSQDETDYVMDTFSPSLLLVNFSGSVLPPHQFHVEVSGAASVLAFGNTGNLSNADRIEIQISKNKNFSIVFQYAATNILGGYSTSNQVVTWQAGPGLYTNSGGGVSFVLTSIGPPAVYTSVGGGGGGGVLTLDPNPSSPYATLVFTKSGNSIDGIFNWATNYFSNNLGRVTGFAPITGLVQVQKYHPASIGVAVTSGASLYHYKVGNTSVMSNFYAGNYNKPYYYQIALSGNSIDFAPQNLLPTPTREQGWHRLVLDLGSGLSTFNGSLDDYNFVNQSFGFSGNIGTVGKLNSSSGISMNHVSSVPDNEFSYFDNVKVSYYTPTQTRPQYDYVEDFTKDWQGSYIDQNAVLSNRKFRGTRQANFAFELIIKGLQNKFLYIIERLVHKLKPAHTLVDLNFQTDHTLNTTALLAEFTGDERNWETGNLLNKINVTTGVDPDDSLDLPGLITISGS